MKKEKEQEVHGSTSKSLSSGDVDVIAADADDEQSTAKPCTRHGQEHVVVLFLLLLVEVVAWTVSMLSLKRILMLG